MISSFRSDSTYSEERPSSGDKKPTELSFTDNSLESSDFEKRLGTNDAFEAIVKKSRPLVCLVLGNADRSMLMCITEPRAMVLTATAAPFAVIV